MSLFLLLNPKNFVDPCWIGIAGEEIKRKRSRLVQEAEEIAKKALGLRPPRTEQLEDNVSTFIGLSNKLLALHDEQESELQEALARKIIEMEDEEHVLLLMLIN